MTYISPYPASTPRERDLSLNHARHHARDIRRKLELVRDPRYTALDPSFEHKLVEMLDEYTTEIHRLMQLKFVRQGAVSL